MPAIIPEADIAIRPAPEIAVPRQLSPAGTQVVPAVEALRPRKIGDRTIGGTGSPTAASATRSWAIRLQGTQSEVLLSADTVVRVGIGPRSRDAVAIGRGTGLPQGVVICVLNVGRGAFKHLVQDGAVVGIADRLGRSTRIGHGQKPAQPIVGALCRIGRAVQEPVGLRDPAQPVILKGHGAGASITCCKRPLRLYVVPS